jgi:hypothetical protein
MREQHIALVPRVAQFVGFRIVHRGQLNVGVRLSIMF